MSLQSTEVRFACFLSSRFTTMAVINSPERKLEKTLRLTWSLSYFSVYILSYSSLYCRAGYNDALPFSPPHNIFFYLLILDNLYGQMITISGLLRMGPIADFKCCRQVFTSNPGYHIFVKILLTVRIKFVYFMIFTIEFIQI